MWVVTSFVIKFVFRRSRSLTDGDLALVAKVCTLVSSRSVAVIAYGAVAIEPSNGKPPDGLTCTVLEKVFRPVYYR